MLVKVGDVVEEGQLLATLDDTDLQTAVTQGEISLRLAEISLETLGKSAGASEVASAQAGIASAKANLAKLTAAPDSQGLLAARENLKSAQQKLNKLLAGADPATVKAAEYSLENAKNSLWSQQVARDSACGGNDHVRCKQAEASVGNADAAVRKAQEDLDTAKAGPTSDEIADARSKVASAQSSVNSLLEKPSADEVTAAEAQITKAQDDLDSLLAGADSSEVEKAKLSVQQAQMSLDSAKRKLEGAKLMAPMAGTVTSVTGQVGDSVSAAAIITLADLANPQLQFFVEETDMASAVPGNAVNIVFEALPDYTYPGKVLSVEPALVSESNTTAVRALASIDLSAHPFKVLSGMNAEVDVVAGEARNALLVPVDALRELGTDQYAVFVIQPDGQQELRPVQVGLKDLVNAEIVSGVQEGETISLGTTQKTTTTSQNSSNRQGGAATRRRWRRRHLLWRRAGRPSMTDSLVIQIRELTKVYGNTKVSVSALCGIDVDVKHGEFVAIMGPSGSGKSTLMNILGCLDRPTSGSYVLNGEDVSKLDKNRLAAVRNREIGFVFQSYNLLPRLSAIKNVMLPLLYNGSERVSDRECRTKAEDALEAVGLADRIHHKPNELSGGQQQRVAVARALINKPSILLADEPTGNLDTHASEEILQLLHELHNRGATILMVTHEPEIAHHAGRIIHLRDGQVVADHQNGGGSESKL